MPRRLLSIFASLSMMGFVLALGLWISSYRMDLWMVRCDRVDAQWTMPNGQVLGLINEPWTSFIRSSHGEFSFGKAKGDFGVVPFGTGWRIIRDVQPSYTPAARGPSFDSNASRSPAPDEFSGQGFGSMVASMTREYTVSDWHLASALLLPPLFWLLMVRVKSIRLSRQMRWEAAYCSKCGYDLRASRDRCPECGMPSTRPRS